MIVATSCPLTDAEQDTVRALVRTLVCIGLVAIDARVTVRAGTGQDVDSDLSAGESQAEATATQDRAVTSIARSCPTDG